MTRMRDTIVKNYREHLKDISSKVPGLEALELWTKDDQYVNTYQQLCHVILQEIVSKGTIYKELNRLADNRTDYSLICPEKFFVLGINNDKTGINVSRSIQQKIFILLFEDKYMMANILFELGYLKQTTYNTKEFISQEVNMIWLCNIIVSKQWGSLIDILSKAKGLEALEVWPRHNDYQQLSAYREFCNSIISEKITSKSLVYKKLKKATKNWTFISMICPRNFLPLERTGIAINQLMQQLVFELLFEDKYMLIYWLIELAHPPDQHEYVNIKDFIGQKDVVANFRDLIVFNHQEMLRKILTVIPGLKELPKDEHWHNYKALCKVISKKVAGCLDENLNKALKKLGLEDQGNK